MYTQSYVCSESLVSLLEELKGIDERPIEVDVKDGTLISRRGNSKN
jgi:hypothetical protein